MSSWPLVKYVDAPTTSAVVRYDFNDQAPNPPTNPAKKVTEFDPGVPTLEGDPDAVGQQWGFRSPSITHTIKGTKAQAMAALNLLSREQLKRTHWLLFQPSAATQPVWFKTYRTGYEPLSLEQVWVRPDGGGTVALPDTWKIRVPLVAEAFTYGARVTIPQATITQAPSGTNPMRVVLPAIKGDAPTALRVTITPSGSANVSTGSSWLVGCVAGSASMTDTVIDIGTGDTVTNINGTAGATADASNAFGGSSRVVTIGAATPNLLDRFSLTLPNTIQPGRYKALLRVRYTAGGTTTLLFRLKQFPNAGSTGATQGPTATVDTTGDNNRDLFVDLGEIALPLGIDPPSDAGGTMPACTLAVAIGTVSGAASSVRVDAIKLIPVDGPTVVRASLLRTYSPLLNGVINKDAAGTFDGDLGSFWSKNTSTGVYLETSPHLQGSFPVADPAAAQNLLLVMGLDGGPGSNTITGTYITSLNVQATVDVSYYPRYLNLGDGT